MGSDPLRVWLLARLIVPLLVVVLAPGLVGDFGAFVLSMLPYPHGMLKWGLESTQGMILRHREIPWVVLGGAVSAVVLSWLPARRWSVGALVVTLAVLAAPRMANWPILIFVPLLFGIGAPLAVLLERRHVFRRLAWIPGSLLLAPAAVGAAFGTASRPVLHRLLVAGAGAGLAFGWMWVDCLASYESVRVRMEDWPAELLDPAITVMAQSPVGVRADWHSVQIVGTDAIVVAETRPRLLAFPLDGGDPVERALRARWGAESAAPLDAETDVATGRTWVVDGGVRLLELRWDGTMWKNGRSIRLPRPMSYAYLRRTEHDQLLITAVQAGGDSARSLVRGTLPALDDLEAVTLHLEDGDLPMPREFIWIPPLQKIALAPEFGSQLYLADVTTGVATPWLEMPTIDGKMAWIPGIERLLVALPNRFEMWVIDPVTGAVDWRIPTQPGVRSVAVDEARGLVLSASVLTGQILVQDLHTGAVRRRLGTVMPMVRELALSPERGEAVLTTWAAVYRFPYVDLAAAEPLPTGAAVPASVAPRTGAP